MHRRPACFKRTEFFLFLHLHVKIKSKQTTWVLLAANKHTQCACWIPERAPQLKWPWGLKNRPTKPPQTLSVWAQSNHKHAHLPQNNQKATTKWYETTSEILSNQYEFQQHHKKQQQQQNDNNWQKPTERNICKMMWNKTRDHYKIHRLENNHKWKTNHS